MFCANPPSVSQIFIMLYRERTGKVDTADNVFIDEVSSTGSEMHYFFSDCED